MLSLPWSLSIPNGILLGALSPGVMVPSVMMLIENRLGLKKGIPQTMLTACTLDNLIAVLLFSTTVMIAKNEVTGGVYGGSILIIVSKSVGYSIAGILIGGILGYSLKCIRSVNRHTKAAIMTVVVLLNRVVCHFLKAETGEYIGIIAFGYGCSRAWENDRPAKTLAHLWKFMKPCLFGSIGATMVFEEIRLETVGYEILIVIICLICRQLAALLATLGFKDLEFKEKAFLAVSWMPKATVQAALGGTILNFVREDLIEDLELREEWRNHGKTMLTSSIFAIIITVPIGTILINTLSHRWLQQCQEHPEDPEQKSQSLN